MKAPRAGKARAAEVSPVDGPGEAAGLSSEAIVALTEAATTRTAQVIFFMSMVIGENNLEKKKEFVKRIAEKRETRL